MCFSTNNQVYVVFLKAAMNIMTILYWIYTYSKQKSKTHRQ